MSAEEPGPPCGASVSIERACEQIGLSPSVVRQPAQEVWPEAHREQRHPADKAHRLGKPVDFSRRPFRWMQVLNRLGKPAGERLSPRLAQRALAGATLLLRQPRTRGLGKPAECGLSHVLILVLWACLAGV